MWSATWNKLHGLYPAWWAIDRRVRCQTTFYRKCYGNKLVTDIANTAEMWQSVCVSLKVSLTFPYIQFVVCELKINGTGILIEGKWHVPKTYMLCKNWRFQLSERVNEKNIREVSNILFQKKKIQTELKSVRVHHQSYRCSMGSKCACKYKYTGNQCVL